jgi:hypothetical protein
MSETQTQIILKDEYCSRNLFFLIKEFLQKVGVGRGPLYLIGCLNK